MINRKSNSYLLDRSIEMKRQINKMENDFIEKENQILKKEIYKLQA